MKKILLYSLRVAAAATLRKFRPEIVGVTGSVGKTSAKEAIFRVLRKHFKTRRNIGNYNNEIGVPLTILGLASGGRSLFSWLGNFVKAARLIFFGKKYPEILVLEMGVDKPDDMKYLTGFVQAKVGVMTAIGEFPVHLEFFPEKGKLVEEKAVLLKKLRKKGLAVLNYDDLSVRALRDSLPEKVKLVTYGFGQGADIRIADYELTVASLDEQDFGIVFKLNYQGNAAVCRLKRVIGKQHAYAAAAAAAVGLNFGLSMKQIVSSLRDCRSLPGRAKLMRAIKNSWLIDDSYNASPLAVIAGLDLLDEMAGKDAGIKRKIAILGDMLELGKDTEIAHRRIGEKASRVADLIFAVGERAVFIVDAALAVGFPKDRIFRFALAEEAGQAIQERMASGDLLLIKGSRSIHLERVVKEVMAHPEKADKLLVH